MVSERTNPGPVEPGTPPRNLQMLCYLDHLPAAAGRAGSASVRQGSNGLHISFNCSNNSVPQPTDIPSNDWLGFDDWIALEIHNGTTIADLPPTERIIEMGMSVLGVKMNEEQKL